MNKMLLLCVVLFLAACSADTLPTDPDELRSRANQIEDEQARSTALAQAAAIERQNSTRGAATVAAFEVTQQAAQLALSIERDSATGTAVAANRSDSATMGAMVAEATGTAVARVTEDAQAAALFQQELDYDRRQMDREIVFDYIKNILVVLFFATIILFLAKAADKILERDETNAAQMPQMVEAHGAVMLRDSSRASTAERLLSGGNSGPWVVVNRPRVVNDTPLLPPPAPLRQVELPQFPKGHVLIAGETDSGKTTAMLDILKARRNITVLDPHAAPGEWPGGARVIGGGRDFQSINEFMTNMQAVLSQRYMQRDQGVTRFENITVATDEMPAIVSKLGSAISDAWREWLREGRKVGLFFIVATQSTRVKTLGIEGERDLLTNFAAVIELGKVAKENHPDLVIGQNRPAVLTTLREGARPIVIPYNPQHNPQPQQVQQISAPAPFDNPAVSGLDTEKGRITAAQFQMAARLLKQQAETGRPSGNAIQRAIWEHSGGNAYYYLKQIEQVISEGSRAV